MTDTLPDRPVRVYDVDGHRLARVAPGIVIRGLRTGEIRTDDEGRYRLAQTGGYRTPAQVAADKAAAAWERTYGGKAPEPTDNEIAAKRRNAALKAAETRRRNAGKAKA